MPAATGARLRGRMPSSKGSRRRGAMKRQAGIARARRAAAVELGGIDGAVAKLRARAQAGEPLTDAQRELLDRHGGVHPPSFD
jgi:hypothetical protein